MNKALALVGLLVAVDVHADPAEFKKHMKAGLALGNQNKWTEAQAELEAATHEETDPRAFAELGWAALQAGDVATARNASARALDLTADPKLRATALLNLGLAEAKDNHPGLARRSFEASLALRPNKLAQQELAKVSAAEVNDACYDTLAQVMPIGTGVRDQTGARKLASASYYCDTPARIAIAEVKEGPTRPVGRGRHGGSSPLTGKLVLVERKTGAVSTDSVAGACIDDCWPEGHAGCSEMSGCTVKSSLRGAMVFKIWAEERFLGDVDSADKSATCAPGIRGGMIRCSTAHHLAIVDTDSCGDRGTKLAISLYDPTTALDWSSQPARHVDGDRDFMARTPTFTFGDVKLEIGGANQPSTLTVDGKTEPCLAVAF